MLLDTLGGFITEPRGQVLEDYDNDKGDGYYQLSQIIANYFKSLTPLVDSSRSHVDRFFLLSMISNHCQIYQIIDNYLKSLTPLVDSSQSHVDWFLRMKIKIMEMIFFLQNHCLNL